MDVWMRVSGCLDEVADCDEDTLKTLSITSVTFTYAVRFKVKPILFEIHLIRNRELL